MAIDRYFSIVNTERYIRVCTRKVIYIYLHITSSYTTFFSEVMLTNYMFLDLMSLMTISMNDYVRSVTSIIYFNDITWILGKFESGCYILNIFIYVTHVTKYFRCFKTYKVKHIKYILITFTIHLILQLNGEVPHTLAENRIINLMFNFTLLHHCDLDIVLEYK